MVRKGNYKLIFADGYDPLLFDLAADPREQNNLAGTPGMKAMADSLLAEVLNDWDPTEIRRRVLANQRNRDLFLSAEEAIREATGTTGFPWR